VITIIVMIILASAILISLSNSGIIGKANEAVKANDLKSAQNIAALAWAEAYLDKKSAIEIESYVRAELQKHGITDANYKISFTDTGVSVSLPTLGDVIKGAEDYGRAIDYSVTVDGEIYDKWQVLYETDEYVYIISSENVGDIELYEGIAVSELEKEENELYSKFQIGDADKFILKDELEDDTDLYACQRIAKLIREYSDFANTTNYGTNVVGAIGGPTIELVVASWNAKVKTPQIPSLIINDYGYWFGESEDDYDEWAFLSNDNFLIPEDYEYFLASPTGNNSSYLFKAGAGCISYDDVDYEYGIRPVVCLKSTTPADSIKLK